jgi:hypothetical protein
MAAAEMKTRMERLLPISGILLITGLMIEAATLLWISPAAFLTFILGGGVLVMAGSLIFLYALL